MPKPIVKIGHTTIEVDGLKVHSWQKRCPYCHREYTTTSRSQKFCSDDCCKKYNKRQREQKKRYEEVKPIERLRVRSHSIAVDILDQLVSMGLLEKKCSCCGSSDNIVVHHKDLNFFNNTPSNLQYVCVRCHNKIHSDLEKKLAEDGILLSEFYDKSVLPFLKVLNKNSSDD